MAFNKIQHPLKMKTLDLHPVAKAVLQASVHKSLQERAGLLGVLSFHFI